MQPEAGRIQLTFHYINGQTESYNVYDPIEAGAIQQEIQQEIRRILEKPWWILHLPEQTVYVNTANVLKIEIKPGTPQIQGEGVFANAQRVTNLTRAHNP